MPVQSYYSQLTIEKTRAACWAGSQNLHTIEATLLNAEKPSLYYIRAFYYERDYEGAAQKDSMANCQCLFQ